MAATQPRYEWRAWSDRLDDVAARIRAVSEYSERRSSAEDYIVSRMPGVNAKVRARHLDIKALRSVTEGFQQWDVAVKVPFPVTADSLAAEILPLLGVAPVSLGRAEYSLEELFEDVVKPHPDLADVEVEKRREFHTVDGCAAELADVTIAGRSFQTAAIESVDLESLRHARRLTGLDLHDNVSYPEMLRRCLGWTTVRLEGTHGS
jgi:hypothetical protein